MKLLFYSHFFAPSVGGVETYSLRLVEGLASRTVSGEKIKITVVTQTSRGNGKPTEHLPIEVVRKPGWWRLGRLVSQSDVVMLAGAALAPLIICLVCRRKLILTHHGYQTICPNGLLFYLPSQMDCPEYFLKKKYLRCVQCGRKEMSLWKSVLRVALTFPRRILSRFATRNVFVSEHSARRIQLANSVVIRNSVPEVPTERAEWVSKQSSSAPPFLYVGRLVVEKGVKVIIEAAAILKGRGREFRIVVAGDGPERESLERQAMQRGVADKIEFLGFRIGSELEAIDNLRSVFLMPSLCQDVAPLAPLEQMMRGKPIIASDIGGLSEEVGDAGLKFPPGNATALADEMEKLILHPELAVTLGARARERALQRYRLDKMIESYAHLLEVTAGE